MYTCLCKRRIALHYVVFSTRKEQVKSVAWSAVVKAIKLLPGTQRERGLGHGVPTIQLVIIIRSMASTNMPKYGATPEEMAHFKLDQGDHHHAAGTLGLCQGATV